MSSTTKRVDMHLSTWRGRNNTLKAIHSLVHTNGLNTHSNYKNWMHFLHLLLAWEFVDTLPLGKCFIILWFCNTILIFRSYWSKGWPFGNESFSSVMSSRRFELILKFLHLSDSENQPARGTPDYDKLYKVRLYINILLENFKNNYIPFENLSIDESIIGYKGRLSFIQYMPKKPHKWEIKAWVLADSSNGYTWGWKLYTGKEEGESSDLGLSHRVVIDLTSDERLQDKGYRVFTDNFYTSPALFSDL